MPGLKTFIFSNNGIFAYKNTQTLRCLPIFDIIYISFYSFYSVNIPLPMSQVIYVLQFVVIVFLATNLWYNQNDASIIAYIWVEIGSGKNNGI